MYISPPGSPGPGPGPGPCKDCVKYICICIYVYIGIHMPTYTNIYAHIPYSYLDGVLDGEPRWGSGSGLHMDPTYQNPI